MNNRDPQAKEYQNFSRTQQDLLMFSKVYFRQLIDRVMPNMLFPA